MSFFDDVFEKIFPKKDLGTAELIHETLVRSAAEITAFDLWKKGERATDLIKEVENAYYLKKSGLDSKLEVHLLDTNYANGFAVSYNPDIEKSDFKFFFDFLKEQTLTLDYRLSQKDRRILDKGKYLEIVEKWYLKPPRRGKEDGLTSQMFGNVLIEHIEIDGVPSYIKLVVNIYQDRLSTRSPMPFEELIDEIFDPLILHLNIL